jgi:uncharacterized membrane protein YeaQ/YmgE (transglycosylase-associated protein family)
MRGRAGEEIQASGAVALPEQPAVTGSKFLGDLSHEEELQDFQFAKQGADFTVDELVAAQGTPGFGSQLVDFVSAAGAEAVAQVGEGLANLAKATDMINPVAYLARAMGEPTFGEVAQRGFHELAEQPREVQEKLGTTETAGGRAGTITGAVTGTVGAQVPGLVGGAELLSGFKALPAFQKLSQASPEKANKIVDFLTKSVGTTEIITQVEEGRPATSFELAAFGVLDAALFGVSKLGRSLYRSAFRGTRTQERNLVKQYGNTIADLAAEFGYTGSPETIVRKTQASQKTLFGQIQELAASNKQVTREEFIETVLPPLQKQFDDLPNSAFKQELVATVQEIVESVAPVTSASGDELVAIITNINKELFGDGTRVVLSPKQAAKLENRLKSEIKDLLPSEIRPLYERYAKEELIEQVMQDARVKQLLGRSAIGAAAGSIPSAVATATQGEDVFTVIKAGIAGAIVGATVARATGNVTGATIGGALLEKAPSTKEMTKIILRKMFPGEES